MFHLMCGFCVGGVGVIRAVEVGGMWFRGGRRGGVEVVRVCGLEVVLRGVRVGWGGVWMAGCGCRGLAACFGAARVRPQESSACLRSCVDHEKLVGEALRVDSCARPSVWPVPLARAAEA